MCEPRFAIRKQAEAAVGVRSEAEVKGALRAAHRLDNAAGYFRRYTHASILYMDWRF